MTWPTYLTNPYQQQLDWLVTMAQVPGFKAHAWRRAKELEADPTGLWPGITVALTEAIGRARASECASPMPQKPHSVGPK